MTIRYAQIYQATYSGKDLLASSEFNGLGDALNRAWTQVTLTYMDAAPAKVAAGMEVLADGTNWNPGSGEGHYRRNKDNSAWVFLG